MRRISKGEIVGNAMSSWDCVIHFCCLTSMFFHSNVQTGEDSESAPSPSFLHFLPIFSFTRIHLSVEAMLLTWRDEHLHFSSLASPKLTCWITWRKVWTPKWVCGCASVHDSAWRQRRFYIYMSGCFYHYQSRLYVFVSWRVLCMVETGFSFTRHFILLDMEL